MELNGLEMTLIGGAIATGAAWIGTTLQARSYQTKLGCDERHKAACAGITEVKEQSKQELEHIKAENKADTGMIMRMLREIVMHLPIEERHKADILNDRGGK